MFIYQIPPDTQPSSWPLVLLPSAPLALPSLAEVPVRSPPLLPPLAPPFLLSSLLTAGASSTSQPGWLHTISPRQRRRVLGTTIGRTHSTAGSCLFTCRLYRSTASACRVRSCGGRSRGLTSLESSTFRYAASHGHTIAHRPVDHMYIMMWSCTETLFGSFSEESRITF